METKEAIPYATIQIGPEYGTIANEEGGFSIKVPIQRSDSLLISSMGYGQKRILLPADDQDVIIYLEPMAIELNEVLLSNRDLTAEEIIREVRAAYPENYSNSGQKYKIFYRGTNAMLFEDLTVAIEKASGISRQQVARASKRLDSLTRSVVESRPIEFRDYSGFLLMKDKDSSKVIIEKATKLIDSRKDISLEGVQEKAQQIILQYLDTTKTYKLKTGLFKIEDSLAFDEEDFRKEKKTEFSIGEVRSSILSPLRISLWHELSFLDKIITPGSYRFKLEGTSFFKGSPIYIISFQPRKGSSKFAGKLYISATDFGVLKADYAYGEGKKGKKFNLKLLLGIKYVENMNRGTIIYQTGKEGKYQPYYIKREFGNYVYLHRPLKFIENSKAKEKILFDFRLEGEGLEKQELLILDNERLEPGAYMAHKEAEQIPFTLLKRFEPTIWQDNQIIQPLEEMKNFKAED